MINQSVIPKPISEYDLRLLRVFVSVVENDGFSAAASALGLTRSTISLHMSNLETRMGFKLCTRGRAGFSLTEEGREVYGGVVQLFDAFQDFSFLIGSLGKELSGEVVILCADQLDNKKQKLIGEVIQKITDANTKLRIVLDGDSIESIEKKLLQDKAHIGFYPKYHNLDGLSYETIFTENIYLSCNNEHPFFSKTDSEIDDKILSEALAVHPGIEIDKMGRDQLSKLNLHSKSYQFDTRKAMIMSGRYIGFLPLSVIKGELDRGEVRLIRPNDCFYEFNLSIANKKTPRETQKIEIVKSAFLEVFKDE